MRLFAISDLHLSGARPKPMDRFGAHWVDHAARIAHAWRDLISDDDLVLVAGDLSWALKSAEVAVDLDFLASLPGQKVLVKGNHDYWWPDGVAKLRPLQRPDMHFLGHAAIRIGDYAIAGTRFWDFPECQWPFPENQLAPPPSPSPSPAAGPRPGAPDPAVIRNRELGRLRERLAMLDPTAPIRVALLHYPPVGADAHPTPYTSIMDEFNVDWCVFGHIHGVYPQRPLAARCRIHRTEYALTSVDQIDFSPLLLCDNSPALPC